MMNLNQEFVEQLEEIDNYALKHKDNNLTAIVLKQLRKDFIDSYIASMNTGVCEHKNLIDKGYYNFKNNSLVEGNKETSKYHKFYCPTCKNEIIYENKEKILCKTK